MGQKHLKTLLRDWRLRKGMKQQDAADFLHMPVDTYRGWEYGKFKPEGFALAQIVSIITEEK